MRSITVSAFAAICLFIGSAQAGQVYIDGTSGSSLVVSDNCNGACFSNLSVIDGQHITFDWHVSIGSEATEGVFAGMLFADQEISDLLLLDLNLGSPVVHVSVYADGGIHDLDAIATSLLAPGSGYELLRVLYVTGGMQNIADYMNFSNNTSVDQLFIASNAQVPEPGTIALMCAGLAGAAFARRRRKA